MRNIWKLERDELVEMYLRLPQPQLSIFTVCGDQVVVWVMHHSNDIFLVHLEQKHKTSLNIALYPGIVLCPAAVCRVTQRFFFKMAACIKTKVTAPPTVPKS